MAEDNTAEPLRFKVVEKRKVNPKISGATYHRIEAQKPPEDRTDEESRIVRKVNARHDVPEDAEDGDEFTVEELAEAIDRDLRPESQKEQDALREAREAGETVTVWKTTDFCDDSSKQCSTDTVRKVATPDGEIETQREHTF